MNKVVELKADVARNADAIKCHCGGYAERKKCTEEELTKHNCGRAYECCARAFVCSVCGDRLVGSAEPPEMD